MRFHFQQGVNHPRLHRQRPLASESEIYDWKLFAKLCRKSVLTRQGGCCRKKTSVCSGGLVLDARGVDEQRRPGGTHKQFKLQIAGQFYYMRRNNSTEAQDIERVAAAATASSSRFLCCARAKKICALGISIATCIASYTSRERLRPPLNQVGAEIPQRSQIKGAQKRHEIFIFVIETALKPVVRSTDTWSA